MLKYTAMQCLVNPGDEIQVFNFKNLNISFDNRDPVSRNTRWDLTKASAKSILIN